MGPSFAYTLHLGNPSPSSMRCAQISGYESPLTNGTGSNEKNIIVDSTKPCLLPPAPNVRTSTFPPLVRPPLSGMVLPRHKHGGVYGLLSYYFLIIIHVCTGTDNLVAPMYHLVCAHDERLCFHSFIIRRWGTTNRACIVTKNISVFTATATPSITRFRT
jgi:hypothetical protein